MIAFSGSWGGGSGRIQRRAPSTRLLCGILAFASCSAAGLNNLRQLALFLGVLTGWAVWCGIPLQKLRAALLFSACLFLPLLLLAPWVPLDPDSSSRLDSFRIPLTIGLRGTACIIAFAATLSVLTLSEFGQGLAGLRLPRALVALIMQIVHQTAMLTDESRRMIAALRVRGVATATMRSRLHCIFSLPVIWLLRLMLRAERVSAAMEVRGFDGTFHSPQPNKLSPADRCAAALCLLVFGAVLLYRWMVKS